MLKIWEKKFFRTKNFFFGNTTELRECLAKWNHKIVIRVLSRKVKWVIRLRRLRHIPRLLIPGRFCQKFWRIYVRENTIKIASKFRKFLKSQIYTQDRISQEGGIFLQTEIAQKIFWRPVIFLWTQFLQIRKTGSIIVAFAAGISPEARISPKARIFLRDSRVSRVPYTKVY